MVEACNYSHSYIRKSRAFQLSVRLDVFDDMHGTILGGGHQTPPSVLLPPGIDTRMNGGICRFQFTSYRCIAPKMKASACQHSVSALFGSLGFKRKYCTSRASLEGASPSGSDIKLGVRRGRVSRDVDGGSRVLPLTDGQ